MGGAGSVVRSAPQLLGCPYCQTAILFSPNQEEAACPSCERSVRHNKSLLLYNKGKSKLQPLLSSPRSDGEKLSRSKSGSNYDLSSSTRSSSSLDHGSNCVECGIPLPIRNRSNSTLSETAQNTFYPCSTFRCASCCQKYGRVCTIHTPEAANQVNPPLSNLSGAWHVRVCRSQLDSFTGHVILDLLQTEDGDVSGKAQLLHTSTTASFQVHGRVYESSLRLTIQLADGREEVLTGFVHHTFTRFWLRGESIPILYANKPVSIARLSNTTSVADFLKSIQDWPENTLIDLTDIETQLKKKWCLNVSDLRQLKENVWQTLDIVVPIIGTIRHKLKLSDPAPQHRSPLDNEHLWDGLTCDCCGFSFQSGAMYIVATDKTDLDTFSFVDMIRNYCEYCGSILSLSTSLPHSLAFYCSTASSLNSSVKSRTRITCTSATSMSTQSTLTRPGSRTSSLVSTPIQSRTHTPSQQRLTSSVSFAENADNSNSNSNNNNISNSNINNGSVNGPSAPPLVHSASFKLRANARMRFIAAGLTVSAVTPSSAFAGANAQMKFHYKAVLCREKVEFCTLSMTRIARFMLDSVLRYVRSASLDKRSTIELSELREKLSRSVKINVAMILEHLMEANPSLLCAEQAFFLRDLVANTAITYTAQDLLPNSAQDGTGVTIRDLAGKVLDRIRNDIRTHVDNLYRRQDKGVLCLLFGLNTNEVLSVAPSPSQSPHNESHYELDGDIEKLAMSLQLPLKPITSFTPFGSLRSRVQSSVEDDTRTESTLNLLQDSPFHHTPSPLITGGSSITAKDGQSEDVYTLDDLDELARQFSTSRPETPVVNRRRSAASMSSDQFANVLVSSV